MKGSRRHINRYILIVGFLFLLILPNLILISGWENTENNENKIFDSPPETQFNNPKQLLADYRDYYEQNFGLRTTLINLYFNIKTKVFKDNPLPNNVVKGANGWYFLGNDHNNILNDTFGNVPFTDAELNSITRNLETINGDLKSRNIKFYIVVPPNKQTIYQEKLPYQWMKHPTRLEQLQNHLNKRQNLSLILLTPKLMAEKENKQLYHKTDTHWNDYGAYLGYMATIDVIKNDFEISAIPLSKYSLETKMIKGDIPALINQNVQERSLVMKKKDQSKIDTLSPAYTFQHYKNRHQNLKLMMHSDSFSDAWIPFFNESFGETLYVRKYTLDASVLDKLQPDVVIFQIVERNLSNLIDLETYK